MCEWEELWEGRYMIMDSGAYLTWLETSDLILDNQSGAYLQIKPAFFQILGGNFMGGKISRIVPAWTMEWVVDDKLLYTHKGVQFVCMPGHTWTWQWDYVIV